MNLTNIEGNKVRLKDYSGKLVVLNFWATWCGPCKEEMPMYVSIEKEWAPRGIVFIGASLDDRSTQRNIPAFLHRYDIHFAVWIGATVSDLDRLGMGEAVPDTAFIDESGAVIFRVRGEIHKPEMLERLQWLSGDRKGPAPQSLLHNL